MVLLVRTTHMPCGFSSLLVCGFSWLSPSVRAGRQPGVGRAAESVSPPREKVAGGARPLGARKIGGARAVGGSAAG